MRDLVILAAWVVMLPLALTRPFVGAMLWMWTAFLSPAIYLYGFLETAPFNKISAAVTLLGLALDRGKASFRFDTVFRLLLALLVLGLVSASASISTADANWTIYGRLAKTVALCAILQAVASNRLRMHALVVAFCLGLGFHGVIEGLKFIGTGGGHHVMGNDALGDNNDFALLVLMVLPPIAWLYRYTAGRVAKGCLAAAFLLCLLSVIGTFSRGGFIGLLAVALGAVRLSRHKLPAILALVMGMALLTAFAPAAWQDRIHTIDNADQDDSFMSRIVTWKMSVLEALDRPLMGAGFYSLQDPGGVEPLPAVVRPARHDRQPATRRHPLRRPQHVLRNPGRPRIPRPGGVRVAAGRRLPHRRRGAARRPRRRGAPLGVGFWRRCWASAWWPTPWRVRRSAPPISRLSTSSSPCCRL